MVLNFSLFVLILQLQVLKTLQQWLLDFDILVKYENTDKDTANKKVKDFFNNWNQLNAKRENGKTAMLLFIFSSLQDLILHVLFNATEMQIWFMKKIKCSVLSIKKNILYLTLKSL